MAASSKIIQDNKSYISLGSNIYATVKIEIQQPNPNTNTNCQARITTTTTAGAGLTITVTSKIKFGPDPYRIGPYVNMVNGADAISAWKTVTGLSCSTTISLYTAEITFTIDDGSGSTYEVAKVYLYPSGQVYWSAYTLSLQVKPNNAGTVTTSPAYSTGDLVETGTTVTLKHFAFNGYNFVDYSGSNVSITNNSFKMPSYNTSIIVNFAKKATALSKPTLTVSPTNPLYSTSSNRNVTYNCTPATQTGLSYYQYYVVDSTTGQILDTDLHGNPSYKDYFSMPRIGHTISVKARAITNDSSKYITSDWSDSKQFAICGQVVFYNGTTVVKRLQTSSNVSSSQFPSNPTKTGYTFMGWFTAASGGTQKASCTIDEIRAVGILNLYAHWQVKSFTVKFLSSYGGTCTPSQESVNYGSTCSLSDKTAPSRSGYRHTGWSKSSGGNKVYGLTDSFTVDGDITLYAYYEANYNVEYNLNAPKSIVDNTPLQVSPPSITGGEKIKGQPFSITTTIPVITGYKFVKWTDDENTAYQPGDSYIKDQGTDLKANWQANNYTVTYKPSSNGPQFESFTQSISFNTAPILPDYPDYDIELYRPKNPFWIVQNNGQIVAQGNPGDTYPMIYANDNTVIIPQWTQITYWRGGWLWIYVSEEGGFQ